MTQLKMNGNSNGNGHSNGHSNDHADDRTPPQVSFSETNISPSSFFGKLRKLYSEQVLKTQLDQLKNQGSYDAFKLGWHPAYDVRRLHGAKMRVSHKAPALAGPELSLSYREQWKLIYSVMESHLVCSGNQMSGNGMPCLDFLCYKRANHQDRSSLLLPSFPRWCSISPRRNIQKFNSRTCRYD